MKNQYFGDINDYRKYGLIRAILRAGKFRLLVAWMLTPDDGSIDGKFTGYLRAPDIWQRYDGELYNGIQSLLSRRGTRRVLLIENTSLLPQAKFFSHIVPEQRDDRKFWADELLQSASESDFVFLDPDNGLEVKSKPYGRKGSSKYLYRQEVTELWEREKSLLIYQHFCRQKRQIFIHEKLHVLQQHTSGSTIEAFVTPHVLFLLALQPTHQQYRRAIVADVKRNWGEQILRWKEAA